MGLLWYLTHSFRNINNNTMPWYYCETNIFVIVNILESFEDEVIVLFMCHYLSVFIIMFSIYFCYYYVFYLICLLFVCIIIIKFGYEQFKALMTFIASSFFLLFSLVTFFNPNLVLPRSCKLDYVHTKLFIRSGHSCDIF